MTSTNPQPNGDVIDASTAQSDQDSITSKRKMFECIPIQPDSNAAWLVVIAAFVVNMLIDGFLYSFGAISKDLKKHFQCQEWAVSLVISLACGFYLLSAPIAATFCSKYGCGIVGICGTVIASVSITASAFSPNIYIMWLLFGICGGIGMGFMFLPSIVIVGHCFDEKRAIATGIVTGGTGIGTITFAPLLRFLFVQVGWQSGLQWSGASMMLCAICFFIILPFQPIRVKDDVSVNQPENSDDNNNQLLERVPLNRTDPEVIDGEVPISSNTTHKQMPTHQLLSTETNTDTNTNTLDKKLLELRRKPSQTGSARKKNHIYQVFVDICQAFSQYKNPTDRRNFIFLCLANILSMIGYFTPYLFVPQFAQDEKSIDENRAVQLISIIGISNTIGRFLSGLAAKLPLMKPIYVNNIGLIIAGLSTLSFTLCKNYTALATCCIIWGGSIAMHVSLNPVIICDIFGLDKFSSTLSITLMFRGVTSLLAPPLMGYIKDITSSFVLAFIIGGSTFILCGILHFAIKSPKRIEINDSCNA